MVYILVGPLMRATGPTSAVIWAAFSEPGDVVLTASPMTSSPTSPNLTVTAQTVTVGNHHFAAPQLLNLQPGTWYHYHFSTTDGQTLAAQEEPQLAQCFRTLDASDTTPLSFVYGSCRKLFAPKKDTLSFFGRWLMDRYEERETRWPRFQLFIGDQIYADQPPPTAIGFYPHLRDGAKTFEDFSLLYTYTWTIDTHTRQALAVLPTYMIFDDHEIDNNWNGTPTWTIDMAQAGKQEVIVDGIVAYWVYQGWGNISERDASHPLLDIMKTAARNGTDALAELRSCVRLALHNQLTLQWHYMLPTPTPIFVTDVRTERTQLQEPDQGNYYGPTRIMGKQQMQELTTWMQATDTRPAIFVSSVPILLPPLIGLAEYLTGIRPLWHAIPPLRKLSQLLARLQLRLSRRLSFDHWPLYIETWRELVHLIKQRRHDLVVLSGDVHFSYTLAGRPSFTRTRLYQLVCTPIQNTLGKQDLRMIQLQAPFKLLPYGGLTSQVLPLYDTDGKKHIPHDILLHNTLAYVTCETRPGEPFQLQQHYLGVIDERMEMIAQSTLP